MCVCVPPHSLTLTLQGSSPREKAWVGVEDPIPPFINEEQRKESSPLLFISSSSSSSSFLSLSLSLFLPPHSHAQLAEFHSHIHTSLVPGETLSHTHHLYCHHHTAPRKGTRKTRAQLCLSPSISEKWPIDLSPGVRGVSPETSWPDHFFSFLFQPLSLFPSFSLP